MRLTMRAAFLAMLTAVFSLAQEAHWVELNADAWTIEAPEDIWTVAVSADTWTVVPEEGIDAMTSVEKEPGETADLTVNWGSKFLGSSRTIASSAWTTPSGITEGTKGNTTTTATVRLSGGTNGSDYIMLNTVTLSNGEIRTHRVRVEVRVKV